jgi:hypothetical protein
MDLMKIGPGSIKQMDFEDCQVTQGSESHSQISILITPKTLCADSIIIDWISKMN